MYMIFEQTISRVITETKAVITHVFSWLIPESIPLQITSSSRPPIGYSQSCVADFARVDG